MGHRPQRQCCDTSHTEVSIFIYPAHPTGANKQVKLTPSRLRPSPISLGWIPVRGSGLNIIRAQALPIPSRWEVLF